jgi:hypothetical protein
VGWQDYVSSALSGAIEIVTDALDKASAREDQPTVGAPQAVALPVQPPQDDPKGLLFDPFALVDQLGYRDRPSSLTYDTLRMMAKKVAPYTAILQTRVTQVSSFAQRQTDPRDPGFGIVMRDMRKQPSPSAEKRIRQLEDLVLHTGANWQPGRDSFRTFLRKLVRDMLILDQGCFEIVRNRKGIPAEFYALDGGTIRMADVPPSAGIGSPDDVRYVQVYDEVVVAEFGVADLCFGVRNPRTDIRCNGYGLSELEQIINVITAALWAFEHNSRFFAQGTAAKGILNFKGAALPQQKIDAFRRQWKAMISGVGNAHRIPMTAVDELQWIDLHSNNRDMEFSAWMDWLVKLISGVMQFDPAEINFTYGNTGQANQMFATPVDSKLKASKDRGLRPLLYDIAQWLNEYVIWHLDPDFELQFLGLDGKNADQAVDLAQKEAGFKKTVDEIRAEDDLPPLPDGKGAVILNQVWLQNKQQAEAAAQQQQMGGAQGGDEQQMQGGDEQQMPGGDGQEMPGGSPMDLSGEDGQPNADEDFEAMFPDQGETPEQKSHAARSDSLRKGGKKAKVRVETFEIEL